MKSTHRPTPGPDTRKRGPLKDYLCRDCGTTDRERFKHMKSRCTSCFASANLKRYHETKNLKGPRVQPPADRHCKMCHTTNRLQFKQGLKTICKTCSNSWYGMTAEQRVKYLESGRKPPAKLPRQHRNGATDSHVYSYTPRLTDTVACPVCEVWRGELGKLEGHMREHKR